MLRSPSAWSTVTVPRPATVPRCVTRPDATESTLSPGRAARSSPRCPAAHGLGGARKRRSTGGRGTSGHCHLDADRAVAPTCGTEPGSNLRPAAATAASTPLDGPLDAGGGLGAHDDW